MKTSIGRHTEIIRAIKKKDETGESNSIFRHPDSIKNN